MDTPWQLPWIAARLAPRWIVEHLAGQRAAHVRIALIDASPAEAARVRHDLGARLGPRWETEVVAISSADALLPQDAPVDVVWALGPLGRGTWDDRLRLAGALGEWLAPGGYLFAAPTDVAAWGSALAPCSAPGVFVKTVVVKGDGPMPEDGY